jgi:gas vesicle protein
MTSSDPEVIRRQIEETRSNLSYDVDALNEKVNPTRVVDRRVGRAKSTVSGLKDRVFGSAQETRYSVSSRTSGAAGSVQDTASNVAGSVQGAASSAAGSVQGAASTALDAVQSAPQTLQRQAQGNPLAAGLIAFGVGWLVSSLLPTSEKEKQLAAQAESAIKEHSQPLVDQAKSVASEIGDNLKPAAQEAVESVKATAQDGVQTVKAEGQSAAQDVQGTAQDAKTTVQGHASS